MKSFSTQNSFLSQQWRRFLVAVMFFTRIPVGLADVNDSDLNRAVRFFPLVGILVGIAGALVFWLCDHVLPLEISVLLSMAATVLLTGAFHEDGLADAIDGLGGGWTKEQVLTIMVDSRLGSYGAIGLVLALLIKYQALSYQVVELIPYALIAGHALSRLCAVLVMATQQYVKPVGKAKPLATQLNLHELILATFFGLLPMALLAMKLLFALIPVALVWLWFSWKIHKRIGGYTGDCLGAMQQLTEVAFHVGILASITLFL